MWPTSIWLLKSDVDPPDANWVSPEVTKCISSGAVLEEDAYHNNGGSWSDTETFTAVILRCSVTLFNTTLTYAVSQCVGFQYRKMDWEIDNQRMNEGMTDGHFN